MSIKNWLFDKSNNKISPFTLLDTVVLDDNESPFKTQYQNDLEKKVDKNKISTVATSGQYDDLSNKPSINGVGVVGALTSTVLGLAAERHTHNKADINNFPTSLSDFINDKGYITTAALAEYVLASSLAKVATSGSYNDLSDKPIISNLTKVSELENDSGYLMQDDLSKVAVSGSYNDLSNSPILSTVAISGSYEDLSNAPILSNVATSGNYEDLNNVPTGLSNFNNDKGYVTETTLNNYINREELAPVATSGKYEDLDDIPELSTVAVSGKYEDLNGTPTKLSDFNNDIEAVSKENLSTVAFSGNYSDLNETPIVFNSKSINNLCTALSAALGGTLIVSYNSDTESYDFNYING